MITKEFNEAWNEANVLNEDKIENSTVLKFSEIDLKNPDWDRIKEICEPLAIKWGTQTASNKIEPRLNWPYQFQLLYNAWATETDTLNRLNNDETFRTALNAALDTYYNNDKISKYKQHLADNYMFNNSPNNHEYLCANSMNPTTEGIADIKKVNGDGIDSIEVKFVRNNSLAHKGAHNADLLFVYSMAGTKLSVYKKWYGKNFYSPLITDLDVNVIDNLITVDPPSDRKEFKILHWISDSNIDED